MSQSRRLSLRYLALDTRNGGCGAIIDHRLYVWGGNRAELRSPYDIDGDGAGNDDTSGYSDSGEEEVSDDDGAEMIEVVTTLPRPRDAAHPFDVYDLRTRTWTRQPTSGSAGAGGLGAGGAADADASAAIPNLGLGSSLCAHLPSKTLYLYGGWKDGKFDGEVYRISTGDWVWEILSPEAERACAPERGNAAGVAAQPPDNHEPAAAVVKPSKRYLAGVVLHGDLLCVFGGVGLPVVPGQDPGARYVPAVVGGLTHHYGWNNEYYEFNIKSRCWKAPLGEEAWRPDPIGASVFAKYTRTKALLFGGRGSLDEQCYSNRLYEFDFEERTWTGPIAGGQASGDSVPNWPRGSRFSTLTPMIDPEGIAGGGSEGGGGGGGRDRHKRAAIPKQKMLLLWGKRDSQFVNEETWLLDTESWTWTQLHLDAKPRSWHVACPVYDPSSLECLVVVFGGNAHIKGSLAWDRENIAQLLILPFRVKSLKASCVDAIANNIAYFQPHSTLPPPVLRGILAILQHTTPDLGDDCEITLAHEVDSLANWCTRLIASDPAFLLAILRA